jgi:hypothetical protein
MHLQDLQLRNLIRIREVHVLHRLEFDLNADFCVAHHDLSLWVLVFELQQTVETGGLEPGNVVALHLEGYRGVVSQCRREDRLTLALRVHGVSQTLVCQESIFAIRHDQQVRAILARTPPFSAFTLAAPRGGASGLVIGERASRINDGSVASAATEIAVQRLFNLMRSRVRLGAEDGVEAHDDARGAKAALRAVELSDALLYRVKTSCSTDTLHCGDMIPVQGTQGG